MYGDPALPPDFVSLPYANPDAPKGGTVVTANVGAFDSVNPFIQKGNVPWQLRLFAYESLMGRSYDEPFTLYGLLAESIDTGPNREWVEFTLRPEAKFWDGSLVTVDDVIWSYETLGTQGHGRYRGFWSKVDKIEQTGDRSVRLTFNTEDRELALLAGLRPILKKSTFDGVDFGNAPSDLIPVGTSAYVIDRFEFGRNIVLKRNPDYWGANVPVVNGTQNFDEIRIEFYGDANVVFEAFKAGEVSYLREFNAENWATQYEFPAVQSGEIVKSEIPHQRPSGITGFVMNTRRDLFKDWRVREALITAFNFEFVNEALTGGRQPRIMSYFSNSLLSMQEGPATGRVRELLEPFADDLLPGALDGYALPVSDGSERNRKNIRAAMKLLQDAGWSVDQGILKNTKGEPFEFTVLLQQDALLQDATAYMDIYAKTLERLGIKMTVETTDKAQYNEREQVYDFDMTFMRRSLSLSPGNEQYFYWGSNGVDTPGTRNLMGMASPAAEAMIDTMLTATSHDEFVAATRALDRVLTTGRYVIPIHNYAVGRIAHKKALKFPEELPIYGDGWYWLPGVWWNED